MSNNSIEYQLKGLKCIIKSKNRFTFVISYSIGSIVTFLAVIVLILETVSNFTLSILLLVPVLVVALFLLFFFFLVNKIVYYLKGNETLLVTNDSLSFYRKGFYKFHEEELTLDKIIKFGLVSKERASIITDGSYESEGGNIFLTYRKNPKSIWGNITRSFQFGASLNDVEAERVVLDINKFLDSFESGDKGSANLKEREKSL